MTPSSSLLLFPVAGLAFGIILSSVGVPVIYCAVLIVMSLALYLLIVGLSNNPLIGYKINVLHNFWIFLLFLAIGIFDYSMSQPDISDHDILEADYASGIICESSTSEHGDKCIVEIENLIDSSGISRNIDPIKIILNSESIPYEIGDRIIFRFKPQKIADNPNEFKTGYAEYLRNKGIYYRSSAESSQIYYLCHLSTIESLAFEIRKKIETGIERSRLSTVTSHFLITILLGDRAYLHYEDQQLLADAGISHILALSGMHVGILAGIMLWLLLPVNLIGRYKLRLILTSLLLIIYAFITGWAPSTVRAVLMVIAATIGLITQRKNNAWNSLLFATLIILVFTPSALFDAGFQLSFTCVATIIFMSNSLNPINHRKNPWIYKTASLLITTLVATMATWMLGAYYFNQIPIVFLPANMLILPLLPIFIVIAILYLFLYSLGLDFHFMAEILDIGYRSMLDLIRLLSLDGTSAFHYQPTGMLVIIWSILLFLLFFFINGNKSKVIKWSIYCTLVIFICLFVASGNQIKDGFIIQNNSRQIHLLTRISGQENRIKPLPGTITEVLCQNDRLLFLDSPLTEVNKIKNNSYKAVVIGSGFKAANKHQLTLIKTDIFVLASTIKKSHEEEISSFLDSLNINHHSIRTQGTYREMK